MKRLDRVAAGVVFALAAALGPRGADAKDVTIELMNAQGQPIGRATIAPEGGGVRLRVDVTGLAPGAHGIHFHEVGKCEPPSFASAAGHFNPDGKHHGLDNPAGPHAGDFPNLVVGPDGSAHASFVNPRVTLATDSHGLFRSGATSLVIHADPDDEKTDPAGNSGTRIACGVIARVGATRQATPEPPPIPEAGPLARPRSLQQVGAPADATRAAIPPDNPQTPGKIALGQRLFFDGRLSADGSVACSTCHDPARAFTDGRPASIGIKGGVGQRNAPTILNALYNKTQFWDGRAKTLEEQAAFPIVNPVEMGQPSLDAAVTRIAAIAEYQSAFRDVFGRPPNGPDLVRAIASYERTQVSFDSPFDHFIAGDEHAIDDSAKRGWELFNTRGRCNKCHALSEDKRDVTYFTDNDFHNIGIGIIRHDVVALARQAEELIKSGDLAAIDRAAIQTDMSALGRFLITKKEPDIASFKTPDLRNVLVTGPYFHDGSQETLWDVMDHYNKGDGLQNPYLDEDMQPLALTEGEIDDVVAFLASLTSADYAEQGRKELARQREISRTKRPQRDTARAFGPKPPRPKPPAR